MLLLDEPLSNLDARLRLEARTFLKKLQRDLGITTVFVTHDQAEALALADRIAVMQSGKLRQLGSPAGGVRTAGEHLRGELHRLDADEPAAWVRVGGGNGFAGRWVIACGYFVGTGRR